MLTKDTTHTQSDDWSGLYQQAFDKFGPCCQACRSNKFVQPRHLTCRKAQDCEVDDLMPLCDRCFSWAKEARIVAITESGGNAEERRELVLQELCILLGFRKNRRPVEDLLKTKAKKERRLLRKNQQNYT